MLVSRSASRAGGGQTCSNRVEKFTCPRQDKHTHKRQQVDTRVVNGRVKYEVQITIV